MNNPKEIWREIRRRFDPFEPVRKQAWRAERQGNEIHDISNLLGSDIDTHYHLLVMGPWGSGKTTELLRVAAEREAQEDCVIYLDVYRHFELVLKDTSAFERVGAWEVLVLLGLALIQKGVLEGIPKSELHETAKTLGQSWEKLGKASEVSGPSINPSAVFEAAQLLAPALMTSAVADSDLALAVNTGTAVATTLAKSINWPWSMGTSKRSVQDQESEAQELLRIVDELIQIIRSRTQSRRVVLIVDGLDRILEIDHAKALMIDSNLLTHIKNAALVVTAPHALYQQQPALLQSRYQYCYALYNEMVLDKHAPWKDGPGIETLLELYQKRTDELNAPNLIHEEWLRYIAYYSGGHTRHFVRLIRTLADFASMANITSANEASITKAIKQQRMLLEGGMDIGDIQVLEEIIGDPKHALPTHEKIPSLLRDNRLLPYLNDSEWYFPHTMLTMHRLKMPQTRSKPQLA